MMLSVTSFSIWVAVMLCGVHTDHSPLDIFLPKGSELRPLFILLVLVTAIVVLENNWGGRGLVYFC